AIFCGYSKAFVELSLFTLAFAALGVREIRAGRGLLAATMVFGLALASHRAALMIGPAWIALLIVRTRSGRASGPIDWRPILASVLLVAAIGFWIGQPLLAALARVDRAHVMPGGDSLGRSMSLTFAPLRFLDLANLLVLVSPLLPLAVAVAWRRDRR